jgi:hypothetical protein
MIGSTW